MYFFSTDPLVEKFRTGRFDDSAVFPYFMAHVLFFSSPIAFPAKATSITGWDVFDWIATLLITIFGVLHLRKKNGGDFSDQFLAKYFCFSWIVAWQLVLGVFPLLFVLLAITKFWGDVEIGTYAGTIFGLVLAIIYYSLLGSVIARARRQSNIDNTAVADAQAS